MIENEAQARLAELEMKAAYQDDLLDTLNKELITQQQELDNMKKRLMRYEQQVQSMLPLFNELAGDEPPPPHY